MKLPGFVPGLAAGLVLGVALTAFAALPDPYDYTGTVVTFTKMAGKTEGLLTVDDGKQKRNFVLDDGSKGADADLKAGDKVLVNYRMYATKVGKK